LPGGDTQLLIDFKFESTRPEWKDVPLLEQVMALKRKETNWGDTLKGVNVRPLTEQLERLGAAEVDPKKGAGTP